MASDSVIERWLEQDLSDEEKIPNDEGSDVDVDIDIHHALEDSCDSNPEGEESNSEENRSIIVSQPQVLPTEQEFSSEDDVPLLQMRSRPRKKNYFGKNRFRWSSAPTSLRSRTLQRNIVEERVGIKPAYRNELNTSSSPLDIWEKFFTDEMLEKIVRNTNVKIQEIRPNYHKQTCVHDMDLMELKAFIENNEQEQRKS